jgi:hypothetical protein
LCRGRLGLCGLSRIGIHCVDGDGRSGGGHVSVSHRVEEKAAVIRTYARGRPWAELEAGVPPCGEAAAMVNNGVNADS